MPVTALYQQLLIYNLDNYISEITICRRTRTPPTKTKPRGSDPRGDQDSVLGYYPRGNNPYPYPYSFDTYYPSSYPTAYNAGSYGGFQYPPGSGYGSGYGSGGPYPIMAAEQGPSDKWVYLFN